jgi:hypothetical protein
MNQASPGRRGLCCGALSIAALMVAFAVPMALAAPTPNGNTIDTDLRGVVPTTSLAGEGNVQVETGIALTQDEAGPSLLRAWTTPTLMRFGMPSYELRIQSNAYSHVRTWHTVNSGMSDLAFGLKRNVDQSWNPNLSVAVIAQAAFPSGSTNIKNEGVRPEFDAVGRYVLPHDNAVSAVAGVRSDVDTEDSRFVSGVLGLDFSHAWNAQFSTSTELAARQISSASHGGKNLMWDLGGAWRPTPGTQLNARIGWGIKDNDTDLAWTIGIATRFRPPTPGAMTHKQDEKPGQTQSATTTDGR